MKSEKSRRRKKITTRQLERKLQIYFTEESGEMPSAERLEEMMQIAREKYMEYQASLKKK